MSSAIACSFSSGAVRPKSTESCRPVEVVALSNASSRPRSRSWRSGSATPKTARRITSSVIACMLGWTGKARPTGHEASSRSDASRMIGSYARIRSPRNGGSMTLRRERCSDPSSSSSERAPTIGLSVTWRPGGMWWPRSPYNARIVSGCETITSGVLKPWNITLNASP